MWKYLRKSWKPIKTGKIGQNSKPKTSDIPWDWLWSPHQIAPRSFSVGNFLALFLQHWLRQRAHPPSPWHPAPTCSHPASVPRHRRTFSSCHCRSHTRPLSGLCRRLPHGVHRQESAGRLHDLFHLLLLYHCIWQKEHEKNIWSEGSRMRVPVPWHTGNDGQATCGGRCHIVEALQFVQISIQCSSLELQNSFESEQNLPVSSTQTHGIQVGGATLQLALGQSATSNGAALELRPCNFHSNCSAGRKASSGGRGSALHLLPFDGGFPPFSHFLSPLLPHSLPLWQRSLCPNLPLLISTWHIAGSSYGQRGMKRGAAEKMRVHLPCTFANDRPWARLWVWRLLLASAGAPGIRPRFAARRSLEVDDELTFFTFFPCRWSGTSGSRTLLEDQELLLPDYRSNFDKKWSRPSQAGFEITSEWPKLNAK